MASELMQNSRIQSKIQLVSTSLSSSSFSLQHIIFKVKLCSHITTNVVVVLTLKWYYDQKALLFFFSDFETLFTKHSPSGVLGFHFENKTIYLNYNFRIRWSAIITPERIQ